MTERHETLIIGGGQAGLSLSCYLSGYGREHVLLERGRVAERWRSQRWDSFRLLSPNYQTRLPAFRYSGPDPDGFLGHVQVAGLLAGYAQSFGAPLRTGVTVTDVRPGPCGWRVRTDAGVFEAANVVVATGHYDRPRVPRLAAALHPFVLQLHTAQYRSPGQLPAGGVLVVGAGPSGQQIARELALAGRSVFLAVGRHRPLPRRYRGRDAFRWMEQMGMLRRTIDTLPDPQAAARAPGVVLAGGSEDLHLRRLAALGVVPLGRLVDVAGRRLRFGDDLAQRLAEADAHFREFRAKVDTFLGLPVSAEVDPMPGWEGVGEVERDVVSSGIHVVIWATGYRRDYSWLHAPVLTPDGEPVQARGLTRAPGLMFLGLRWMYRRNSNFIDGVGADARFLAEHIVPRRRQRRPPAPLAA